MKTMTVRTTKQSVAQEQSSNYRIKRQFSTQRRSKELIRDLLRAHSGK